MKLHSNRFLNFIYKIFVRLRNPSLNEAYDEIAMFAHLDNQGIKILQKEKLVKLIEFAKDNSVYYKKVLPEVTERQSLGQILGSLPILTKQDALANASTIRTDKQHNFSKAFQAGTSGTSGQALVFPRNKNSM